MGANQENRRIGCAVPAGLAIGALAFMLAFVLAAGGHGWGAPGLFSLLLCVVYPIGITRWTDSLGRTIKLEIAMLALAAIADTYLAYDILSDERVYFLEAWDMVPLLVLVWLCLWSGWQFLSIGVILRNLENRRDDPDETA
ncbi:MAG TPA: hypothetical protein VIT45_13910 [Allosphingosinicella sp.]